MTRKYNQSLFKSLGNYGCYLLCLIDIAEEFKGKEIDKMKAIEDSISNKFVKFNTANYDDSDNFYVLNPVGILAMLTGAKWNVSKENANYKRTDDEYVVELWSLNGKTGHFARTYKGFNSLQKSNCVNNGKIISYRVFTRG